MFDLGEKKLALIGTNDIDTLMMMLTYLEFVK